MVGNGKHNGKSETTSKAKIVSGSGYDHLAGWFFRVTKSWVLVVVLSGILVLRLNTRVYPKRTAPNKQTARCIAQTR